MEKLNVKIAERVKSCRKEHNMTQEQLAEKSGYSVQHISMIENGRRKMTVDTAHMFSKVFNINYEYFLGEEPYKNTLEKNKFNSDILGCIDDTYKWLMRFLGFRISQPICPKDCKNIYDEACVIVEDYTIEGVGYYKLIYRDYLEIKKDILTYAQYRFSKSSSNNPEDLNHLNIEQISKNMAQLMNEDDLGIGYDVFEFLNELEREDVEDGIKFSKIAKKAMEE